MSIEISQDLKVEDNVPSNVPVYIYPHTQIHLT